MHVSFIVYSHLQIPNILHILIKFENSQIFKPPCGTPLPPPFLYYWSDLTEIFTQYVKSEKKHFLFMTIFPIYGLVFLYIQIYINIYVYI